MHKNKQTNKHIHTHTQIHNPKQTHGHQNTYIIRYIALWPGISVLMEMVKLCTDPVLEKMPLLVSFQHISVSCPAPICVDFFRKK